MMKRRRSRRNRRDSRGSALLVSLMVIVGLSLLGLGFVAISETESAIAKNEENALQTQAVAEAGARMVVEWFQDPAWGETYAAMPANSNATIATGVIPAAGAIKTSRTIPDPVNPYTGVYKPQTKQKLCDKPYRPDNADRFFGDEDHADIIINRTTSVATIDAFNDKLLASDGTTATDLDKLAGEVTEIRIYAPPIVNGTLTNGFWVGGQRYGVATIKVTAQQFQNPNNKTTGVIASHSVRLVVGELPLPIPAGPIQGDANVSFGGNFRVHWGMETSRGDLTPSLNLSSLPWANAYERPHFEHGYEQGTGVDAVVVTAGGTGYPASPATSVTISPPPAGVGNVQATATANVLNGSITSITIVEPGKGYDPDPASAPTVTITGPGGTGASAIANVGKEVWPVSTATYEDHDYFHELLGKDFQDPWYGARAYQDNMLDGISTQDSNMQLYQYQYTADEQSNTGPSYAFQWQNTNSFPEKKKVTFPVIKYDYWKKITQAGRGYPGIYYFKYDDSPHMFKKFGQGTAHDMAFWVNNINGAKLGPGVYFFDTKNPPQNPQGLSSTTRANLLTDDELWKDSDFRQHMLMAGFIYMNAASFGTTGQGNAATTIQANFPGEPFRDVGYPVWCLGAGNPIAACTAGGAWANCGGEICRSGIGDSKFSCQDLQTGQPHTGGRCRIVVMQAPSWTSYDPGPTAHASPANLPQCGHGCSGGKTVYVVKTWKSVAQATKDYGSACVAPPPNWDGTQAAGNYCSEPHEPYLNLVFPDTAADNNNGVPSNVVVGWEAPNDQTYRPKTVDSQGNVVACPPPDPDKCITNGYDVDGAVVPLDVILYGILYDEGQWGSEGNAWFFGSVLVQDTINLSSGTADVWFDEKLLKGTWAPPKMPRVIVFSEQTDEQQQ